MDVASAVVMPLDALLARTGHNRSLIVELIDIFEGECADMMAELDRCVAARDAKGVYEAAHRLRGSLRIFGATRAIAAAHELEAMGRSEALEDAVVFVAELDCAAREAFDALREYRAVLAVPAMPAVSEAATVSYRSC